MKDPNPMKKVPDQAGQKTTDPTGSGSLSLNTYITAAAFIWGFHTTLLVGWRVCSLLPHRNNITLSCLSKLSDECKTPED